MHNNCIVRNEKVVGDIFSKENKFNKTLKMGLKEICESGYLPSEDCHIPDGNVRALYTLEKNGEISSLLVYSINIEKYETGMHFLYVKPKYRKKQYATRLIKCLFNYIKKCKDIPRYIELYVHEDNVYAQSLYFKLGFTTKSSDLGYLEVYKDL